MAATTTLLGLVTPTQGTLSGTWGDTVNYGISDYVDISVAGTLTLTNDGAVTLANTTGSSSGNSITSSLTGAGTVTAQFAIVRVTGTLTVAKVVTGPSYSKTYTVVNAATGGIVTFKASGQTGVSVAVGESAFVYFNGTDYVKVSGTVAVASFQTSLGGLTPSTATTGVVTLAGTLNTTSGGTGLTSFTAGDVPYYASGSVLSKLAIGTAGQFLTSTGTAPQWSTLSGVAVTTFSAGTTGFTPNTATSGAITLAGTLATTNGGTGLTSFTSGGVVYASSSSALATGSALTWDGTTLGINNGVTAGTAMSLTGTYAGLGSVNFFTFQRAGGAVAGALRYSDDNPFGMMFGTTTSHAQIFMTANTERMRIASDGSVGIGTSSPAYKLSVVKPSAGITARFTDGDGITDIYGYGLEITRSVAYIKGSSALHLGSAAGYSAVVLDSAGNLGLGVTPSAWLSTRKAFQLGTTGSIASSSGNTLLGENFYTNSTPANIYLANGFATAYQQTSGEHRWLNAASGTAGNAISFTQAMTIDASGRLLVGTTSTTTSSSQSGEVYSAGAVGFLLTNTTAANYALSVKNEGTSGTRAFINFYEGTSGGTSRANISFDNSNNFVLTASNATVFTNGGSERLRIASDGSFGLSGANYGTSGQVLTSGGSGAAPTWTTVAAGLAAATQAEMEAASSNTVSATPSNTKYHPGVAKVWVIANTSGTIGGSYNVASVTDEGVGKLLVTYITAFSSVNYSLNMSIVGGSAYAYWFEQGSSNYAVGSCRAYVMTFAGSYQDPGSSYLVSGFGDQ